MVEALADLVVKAAVLLRNVVHAIYGLGQAEIVRRLRTEQTVDDIRVAVRIGIERFHNRGQVAVVEVAVVHVPLTINLNLLLRGNVPISQSM